MKKILFVVNDPAFFLSHRLPVAFAAQEYGFDVHVASAYGSGVDKICEFGFTHHHVPFNRSGQNPVKEIKSFLKLLVLFSSVKPDLVHLVTIKPVLYGGISARFTRIRSVVAAVSGLGTVFIAKSGLARIRLWIVSLLYKVAFNHKNLVVIFQNPTDRQALLDLKALGEMQAHIIRGSGVILKDYPHFPEPDGIIVVTMASRLLRDKGVFEFVEAARILRKRRVPVLMRLIGDIDSNNITSVKLSDVDSWRKSGIVEVLGYRSDVAEQYAKSNIICLPSYREGLPKSLAEAAACGRAVVTTNVAGCRDAIENSITGILVPVKNAIALADAIQTLVENPAIRISMGHEGRKLAEKAFDIDIITRQHLNIYEGLLLNERDN